MSEPRISIVTICYNAQSAIEKTMISVLNQTYQKIEYLIIDGKSKDNTNQVIKTCLLNYPNRLDQVIHISEKDSGIYDAMNKGIRLATGDWIIFMNADDTFYNIEVLKSVFLNCNKETVDDYDGIYGDTVRIDGDKKNLVKAKKLSNIVKDIPLPFCHQSVFVRRDVLIENPFDLKYKQASDYDMFAGFYIQGRKFKYMNIVVSNYMMGGISETQTVNHLKEKLAIREQRGFEHYSSIKGNRMVSILWVKQKIKKILPAKIVRIIKDLKIRRLLK